MPIASGGSDVEAPFPHGTQAREFELLVKYGMTPLGAVQAGTINGAELLGWGDQIGQLKAGFLADVVAVPGNPAGRYQCADKGWVCDEGRRDLPAAA